MAVTNITWDDILSELARRELKKGNLKLSDKPEKSDRVLENFTRR